MSSFLKKITHSFDNHKLNVIVYSPVTGIRFHFFVAPLVMKISKTAFEITSKCLNENL